MRVRNIAAAIPWGAAVAAAALYNASARAATNLTVFHVGNSLTYQATDGDKLKNHAAQVGINLTWGSHIRCGSGLLDIYTYPTDTCVPPGVFGYWGNALPNNHWDMVTLEPYGDKLADAEYISTQMISLTRSRPDNASTKFYFFQNFPQALTGGETYAQHWVQPYDGSRYYTWTRDYGNRLMADLELQHPELPLVPTLISTGEVLYRLDQLARAGQIPGINRAEDFYADPFHLTPWGTFASETTIFSVLFNMSPNGLAPPSDMPAATANLITQNVWDIVHNRPQPVFGVWKADSSANWASTSSWAKTVPNGAGVSAYFTSAITADRTVMLDTARTLGTVSFDSTRSYTVTGAGALNINSTEQAVLSALSGNHTVTVPVTFQKEVGLAVGPSTTLTLTNLQPTSFPITKAGEGIAIVNNVRAPSVNIATGTLRIAPNGGATGVSRINNITIGQYARLDIFDNKVITKSSEGFWTGTFYTGVLGLVDNGYYTGIWNGYGILTSDNDSWGGENFSIGVASTQLVKGISGTQTAMWAGQTVSADDTLIMYTYTGDANLDGKINVDDYNQIDQAVGTGRRGWSNGDFNYDGKVNIDDYVLIDKNVEEQGAPLWVGDEGPSAMIATSGVAAVPEPVSMSVIGAAAMGLLGSRKRRGR
jgi:hypothetical protein